MSERTIRICRDDGRPWTAVRAASVLGISAADVSDVIVQGGQVLATIEHMERVSAAYANELPAGYHE